MINKAQFSVIEIVLVFSLFAYATAYLYDSKNPIEVDNDFTIESFFDAMYYNGSIIEPAVLENLSNSSVTQDWSVVQSQLDTAFASYSLSVSNLTTTKKIFGCDATYNRYVTKRVVFIYNQSKFNFRELILGVCY